MDICALSGFLGLPHDWDFLSWKYFVAIDWQMFSWTSLPEWGAEFNRWINRENRHPKVLMGYSFGGRLALHALIDSSYRWQAAIVISAHPGIESSQERQRRIRQDQQWAKRFQEEEWTTLMQAWNAQEVFSQDPIHFERNEHHYQRKQLVNAMISGSVGRQDNLRMQIASLSTPILWVTGSKDRRYCDLADSLTFAHPYSRSVQIEHAGHRAPWAQPQVFSKVVEDFLCR
jgi:2-succinyl-6-hydroxy-2,4-cyclohexadiene-1-carboxylate synthase